jgi:hypothetical protein
MSIPPPSRDFQGMTGMAVTPMMDRIHQGSVRATPSMAEFWRRGSRRQIETRSVLVPGLHPRRLRSGSAGAAGLEGIRA